MPYQSHKDFAEPDDPNSKIWRYMDFAKFVSLLDSSALYFPRFDMLKKNDPFEGDYTRWNLHVENKNIENMTEENRFAVELKASIRKEIRRASREYSKEIFVSCWHINQFESAAMWKLYLKSNDGIAIQSTYGKLRTLIDKYDKFPVYSGKVKYIDYEKVGLPYFSHHFLYPFMHKRVSFSYENELRVLICTSEPWGRIDRNSHPNDVGLRVPIDLNELIDRIFVAPGTQEWLADLIRAVLQKYGVEREVITSDLASDSPY